MAQLRCADPRFLVFGSEHHKYRFNPVLPEAEVAQFETRHQIRLPEDYRCFLLNAGDGGVGPSYGLERLSNFQRNLSQPFPFSGPTAALDEAVLDAQGDWDSYPGVLEFCHHGCGSYSYLVVNGPTYGTIWSGYEADFSPTGQSFTAWYREWAERSLRRLAYAKLLPALRLGMSKAEVFEAVPTSWTIVEGRFGRRLHGTDVRVTLGLDEHDVVTDIFPASFV